MNAITARKSLGTVVAIAIAASLALGVAALTTPAPTTAHAWSGVPIKLKN
jgi:hypothetical protein